MDIFSQCRIEMEVTNRSSIPKESEFTSQIETIIKTLKGQKDKENGQEYEDTENGIVNILLPRGNDNANFRNNSNVNKITLDIVVINIQTKDELIKLINSNIKKTRTHLTLESVKITAFEELCKSGPSQNRSMTFYNS